MSSSPLSTSKQKDTHMMSALLNNGPTQAGVMVGIVNAISQPFSQPNVLKALNLSDWSESLPLTVAFAVSVLLAIYQTLYMQKTKLIESLIVIPLVTGILFGMSLGANHLTADMIDRSTLNEENTAASEIDKQKQALQAQLISLQSQIAQINDDNNDNSFNFSPKTRSLPTSAQSGTQPTPRLETKHGDSDNSDQTTSTDAHNIQQQIQLLREKIQKLEKQKVLKNKTRLYRPWIPNH